MVEKAIFSNTYSEDTSELFKKYLSVLEQEKEERVNNAFDFENFLNRDYEDFEVEYEDSDS
jgi:arginyl-tRNA--protein-N-Asp/Glu arginylyltransferase